jgi:hypothetical protein
MAGYVLVVIDRRPDGSFDIFLYDIWDYTGGDKQTGAPAGEQKDMPSRHLRNHCIGRVAPIAIAAVFLHPLSSFYYIQLHPQAWHENTVDASGTAEVLSAAVLQVPRHQ